MNTTSRTTRTCNLELRLSPEAKQILSAAETLAERQQFHLNAEQWETFIAALDEPHRTLPRLQKLFREASPFDVSETK